MLYTLPELSLIIGIIHLCGLYLFAAESDKSYARVARFWLLVSLFFNILFYDRNIYPYYFENNAGVLLFRLPVYFFAYTVFGVSSFWFAAEKKTGCSYNIWLLAVLVVMNVLLAATNLLPLVVCIILLSVINCRLQQIGSEDISLDSGWWKICGGFIVMLLLLSGTISLFILANGEVSYRQLAVFLEKKNGDLKVYLSIAAILISFLYSLGIAPFHFVAEERAAKNILPVSHYFAIVHPLIYWGAFIKLNIMVLGAYMAYLKPVYILFALFSMMLGAVGANARISLHRIYAFGSMYHFGVVLLLLSFFNSAADFSAYIYIILYLLGLNGAYLVFYHLKIRNEYVSTIASLSGIVEHKPYTTGILLISLFSLIGFPPLAGFLAQLDIVYQLISIEHPLYLMVIFGCLLLLVKVYLEIVKTAYFEQNIIIHDAENKFIRLFMAANALCLLTAAFNPFNWLEKFKDMFYVLFI